MTVWIVIHRESYASDEIRSVHTTEKAATAACTTRTPSGRPSHASDAHGWYCCDVEEWEVVE